jgi:prepilin-type processing-associated H-X9-DG protein
MSPEEPRSILSNRNVYKNWYPSEEGEKQELLELLFGRLNMFKNIQIDFMERRELSHSRCLNLLFVDGHTINIRLDQGMGYWIFDQSNINYPFESPVHMQQQWIESEMERINVRASSTFPTHLSIKRNV